MSFAVQSDFHDPHDPASRWLVRYPASGAPAIRLFCFPYAGAGASVYRAWAAGLPHFEVCAVQLPGREDRYSEPPIPRMDYLIDAITDGLRTSLDAPFAVFGHSMGAIVALEFCRSLQRAGLPAPRRLFVSGHGAPHLSDGLPDIHALPDAEFVQAVHERYNGIPAAILAEPELLDLIIPVLRADMKLLETHRCATEPPLACPISAFGGLQDPWWRDDRMRAWTQYTTGEFIARTFPGDHFFVNSSKEAIWAGVRRDLRLAEAVAQAARL